jgi:hypothetical protein
MTISSFTKIVRHDSLWEYPQARRGNTRNEVYKSGKNQHTLKILGGRTRQSRYLRINSSPETIVAVYNCQRCAGRTRERSDMR